MRAALQQKFWLRADGEHYLPRARPATRLRASVSLHLPLPPMPTMPLLRPVPFLLLLTAAAALARPVPAAAQPEVRMCSDQPVPAGYVIVGTASRSNCPTVNFTASYNSLTIRLPGDSVSVCSALSQPPEGYVIVGTASRSNCPSAFGASYNSLTLRLPRDTVTVCTALSQLSEGFVIVGHGSSSRCPSSFGDAYNTATYQRVGGPSAPSGGETISFGPFSPMNPYDRTVFRRMGEVAAWLRLETPTHHPWLARTAHGTTASTRLELDGGVGYTLVAVCDEDCGDVNLRVLEGGVLLGMDADGDDYAVVEVVPARDARVTVDVGMTSCAESPCHFAVGVYETPRPGAVPPRRPPGGDVRVTPRPRPNP
jgi:hypothetical protein